MAGSPPLYWAPDKDPSWLVNPGVLTAVSNMIPRTRGTLANYACTPGERITRIPEFTHDKTPMSAAILQTGSSGSQGARLIIGCNFDGGLIEARSSSMVNVSKVGGYFDYREWQFAAFADTVLATGGMPHSATFMPDDPPQFSDFAGGVFANLTGCTIKAACITVQKGFIVLGNVRDGAGTWYGDGWACSGLNNTASWVANLNASANLATGANYGRLLDAPGQIRALVNLRDGIVAYKPDAMLMGRYTANPFTWSWSLVSDGVGSASGNNVAVVNGMHYFLHRTGVYMFDGSVPRNIGDGKVNEFLARKLQGENLYTYPGPKAVVDDRRNLIYWYFGTNEFQKDTTALINAAFVLNYLTGACGWIDDPWSDDAGGTYNGRGFGCPVMATQEDIALWNNVVAYQQVQSIVTVGNVAGKLQLRTPVIGAGSLQSATPCGITTGDLGDEEKYTLMRGIKPRLVIADADAQVATCTVDGKASQADYFDDEGFMVQGTAPSAGVGYVLAKLLFGNTFGYGMPLFTIAADDYISFEWKRRAGDASTPMFVRLAQSSPAFNYDYGGLIGTTNVWSVARASLAAAVGKVIDTVWAFIDAPTNAGLHQFMVRNIRITDSAGTLRRRLWNASEDRTAFSVTTPPTTVLYTNAFVGGVKSIGDDFTYDTVRRRFQGATSNRFHRAKMTFYNQCELAALELDMEGAGSE